MPEKFLHLSEKDQAEILRYFMSVQPYREMAIAEKDVWVCWVLKQLFEMPHKLDMAFKGGTSLSKVFNLIDRFSEDIDITLDYRQFEAAKSLNLDEGQTAPDSLGSSARRRMNESLKGEVRSYVEDVVAPYLREQLKILPRGDVFQVNVSEEGDCINFVYPSVVERDGQKPYMLEYVLIEFGGRNIINPNAIHLVKPYLGDAIEEFEFPSSNVTVLSPMRTFWEKATLIHVECHRGVRQSAERLSRHWFDLMALSKHEIGREAIQDVLLLKDVVRLKNIFFNASYTHYDQCLQGNFLLLPNAEGMQQLETDYHQMLEANYLNDTAITFKQIIAATKQTQDVINLSIKEYMASVA
ncbi:nucleotidyl transferase AbiEii/AbiGii toxin family protein [Acinetobacter variabilis]|uniref:nucleotidyl transferase AbiEii/AbiGii toxin family protein n=1 Tax=Acinetobacter variabilis TaxID=70346 RepID=UPI0028ACEEC1|nr:nucleotidyl transferase AbiEii/AbiGii toxin family protein [Acinetobacter variabilis]